MTNASQNHAPDGCITLLSRLHHSGPVSARKLTFSGIGQRDVYNIAAPFEMDGRQVIAGRVEDRDVEHAEIVFFAAANGTWQPIPSAMTFPSLQDPCIALIGDQLVLGG